MAPHCLLVILAVTCVQYHNTARFKFHGLVSGHVCSLYIACTLMMYTYSVHVWFEFLNVPYKFHVNMSI